MSACAGQQGALEQCRVGGSAEAVVCQGMLMSAVHCGSPRDLPFKLVPCQLHRQPLHLLCHSAHWAGILSALWALPVHVSRQHTPQAGSIHAISPTYSQAPARIRALCLVLTPLLTRPGTAAAAEHKVQRKDDAPFIGVTPSLASTLSVISIGHRRSRSLISAA